MNYKIQKGKEGELLVAQYLQKQGYTIITQNYRKRFGEVDVIAKKDDTVAFVEVKWRHDPLIDLAEVISPSKQKKITSIAKYFLSNNIEIEIKCRLYEAMIDENNN